MLPSKGRDKPSKTLIVESVLSWLAESFLESFLFSELLVELTNWTLPDFLVLHFAVYNAYFFLPRFLGGK